MTTYKEIENQVYLDLTTGNILFNTNTHGAS